MGHDQRPDGHRWHSSPKIRFAPDSPLEGSGFEPSVPLRECRRSEPLARKETSGVGNGVSSTAEPMVRIWFPPAQSLRTTGSSARVRRSRAPALTSSAAKPRLIDPKLRVATLGNDPEAYLLRLMLPTVPGSQNDRRGGRRWARST